MSAMLQKFYRSFSNTLFYIWTLIKALLSLGSPVSFPLKETSTIVPYTLELDLESGSRKRGRRTRGIHKYPFPDGGIEPSSAQKSALFRPSESSGSSLSAIVDAKQTLHGLLSNESRAMESLSPVAHGDSSPQASAVSLASIAQYLANPAQCDLLDGKGSRGLLPTERSPVETETVEPLIKFPRDLSASLDSVLKDRPLAPFKLHSTDYGLEGEELAPFMLPFRATASPRSQKGSKGHKRTTCTFLASPSFTPIGSQVSYNYVVPSNTANSSYQDLHLTPSVSHQGIVNWSSTGRDGSLGLHVPAKSEVSTALIQAVRDAFIKARENEDSENESKGARQLLNRESVWTCAQFSVTSSNSSTISIKQMASAGELEHSSGAHSSTFKFPSHKYLNSLSYAGLGSEIVNSLSSYTLSVHGRPVRWSADLSNSRVSTPRCSLDSGFDDILVSFEHLMTTMPNLQGSLARFEGACMLPVRNKNGSVSGPGLERVDEGCAA